MKCKYCGKELGDSATFCGRCGKPVERDKKREEPEKRSRSETHDRSFGKGCLISLIVILVLMVLAMGAALAVLGLGIYRSNERKEIQVQEERVNSDWEEQDEEGQEAGQSEEGQDGTEQSEEEREEPEETQTDPAAAEEAQTAAANGKAAEAGAGTEATQSANEQFGINAATVESYSANLDPYQYSYYDSGYEEFRFSYPAGLYNYVTIDHEPYSSPYGVNVETIHFYGSMGSELTFILLKREDGNSLEAASEYVYSHERGTLHEPQDILYAVTDEYGKVIMTGRSDPSGQLDIYDMTKITPDYVMQMYACYPKGLNQQDEQEKSYVVECLYRMCGFSDSKQAVRSFAEYAGS